MKILILAAMTKELDLLLNLIENPHRIEINANNDLELICGNEIWEGKINIHEVFLAKCGIGKVNSALVTYSNILKIKPDLVINSGVAGGAGTPVGTVLMANAVAYHDVWCGPGTDYGQADGVPLLMKPSETLLRIGREKNIKEGLVCSGDIFVTEASQVDSIRSKFPKVMAIDMESASIAQCCILCEVPFAIIRVVSDTPGEGENTSQYEDFWQTAPLKTFDTLKLIIEALE